MFFYFVIAVFLSILIFDLIRIKTDKKKFDESVKESKENERRNYR